MNMHKLKMIAILYEYIYIYLYTFSSPTTKHLIFHLCMYNRRYRIRGLGLNNIYNFYNWFSLRNLFPLFTDIPIKDQISPSQTLFLLSLYYRL